jgi:hypothetical protein
MRVKYTAVIGVAIATGLAPAAHANHQYGDAFIDSGGAREGGTVRVEQATTLERAGFDWADAAVGAGFALGVALVVLGLALLAWRTRVRVGASAT